MESSQPFPRADLRVMARSTVFSYREGTSAPESRPGLKVDAILLAGSRQAATRLSIQTDLVSVLTRELWGEQFRRKLSDLAAIQGDIAKEIYDSLQPNSSAGKPAVNQARHRELRAYQLYLRVSSTGTNGRRRVPEVDWVLPPGGSQGS